jgi:hypothetical protein
MDKLKMHSPDITQNNIARIRELFPECITEARGDDGCIRLAVDFDQLKQALSDSVVEGPQERYRLDWPGKREALLAANAPIAMTLRPCREESVNFDTTKNIYIEGDNLEALKLLQESYLGKVKMIYIDPPYNTGNDFIYDDDFSEDAAAYMERSQQADTSGARMVANTESNGRFHSDWLSMMYPRLQIARRLLREDGVILVSIDENEATNLKKMCEEVFGDKNFLSQIVWKKRNTPPQDRVIASQHEYIICFAKNANDVKLNLRARTAEQISRYKNPDNHPKGPWVAGDLMANVKGGRYVSSLYFPIKNPRTGEEFYPSSNGNWRFSESRIKELIKNNEIYFGEDDRGRPKLKRFLCDVKDGITWTSLWDFAPLNSSGSKEMTELFGNLTVFENPKPTGLLVELLKLGTSRDDIVLDFFAGSSSTADAVMKLNAEDGGTRSFMMIQLPEATEKLSEAYKAGFRTITELGKERIRRSGRMMHEKYHQPEKQMDVGFRALTLDTTNMSDVYYTPELTSHAKDALFTDNIKPDRTPEDLLFQVMLDWGVDLSLPIATETIQGKEVFFVDGNVLVACFDAAGGVDEDLVKALASREPLRVVFRDAGFRDSAAKINVEQVFKLLSPATDVRCI